MRTTWKLWAFLLAAGLVLGLAGCASGSGKAGAKEEGIYVGIIKFAERSEDITGGSPVLLNAAGRTSLINTINSQINISPNQGTALFHAVHLALANIKKNEDRYPPYLDLVNIVTFTDGLDNSSVGLSERAANRVEDKTFETVEDYSSYVNGEINNRTILGKSITAYSVGLQGQDVADEVSFERGLASIASPGKSNKLENFDQLQGTFNTIAENLNVVVASTDFNIATALLENNTRIRMTFDVDSPNPAAAAASNRFIEGVYTSSSDGSYSLTDLRYGTGFYSTQTGPIAGKFNETAYSVSFELKNIVGYFSEEDKNKTRQWLRTPSASTWQHNSEYDASGSSTTSVNKRSTVIYLVLDVSRSLGTTEINQIKTAASDFINNLYYQYTNTTPAGVGSIENPILLASGSWTNGEITSTDSNSSVWYYFNVTRGTIYNVWWNDLGDGNGVKNLDVLVNGQYDDGSPIFANEDSGWTHVRAFSADRNGTARIKVTPFDSGNTGTYAITYGTANTRPSW